jgi:hypothetical protein
LNVDNGKGGDFMDINAIGVAIGATITNALSRLGSYIPQFLGGLVILIVGFIVAAILRAVVVRLFRYLNLERWFKRAGMDRVIQFGDWPNILAEIVRWAVIIIFLIPAVEAWGLPQVTAVLNQLLFFLPNVFVAVVVGFVGLAIANILADVVKTSTLGLGHSSSNLLANIAKYSLLFFTGLIILNQLGVAADLVKILFTGIVAMLALAGGLAFGLGGQDKARQLLDNLNQKIEEEKPKLTTQPRPQQPIRGRRIR